VIRTGVLLSVLALVLGLAVVPAEAAASRPVVTSVSVTSASTSGGKRLTVTGKRFRSVSAVRFGRTKAEFSVVSSRKLRVVVPAHSAGVVHVFVVTAHHRRSSRNSASRFTYVVPPAVTKVSPASGGTAGGTRVTVTGHSFTRVTKVLFGASAGRAITVLSPTTLQVTTPAHAGGAVATRVVSSYGKSQPGASDRFLFIGAPTITSVTPTAGPTGGGTKVDIIGTNFVSVESVTFDSTAGTQLTVSSSTRLSVVAPAHIAGAVRIKVTSAYGASSAIRAAGFTYEIPGVTGLTGTPSVNGVELAWTNPTFPSFAGVMIRRNVGSIAPTSPTDGTLVADVPTVAAPANTYTDASVPSAMSYAYSVFAADSTNFAPPASVVVENAPPGPVTGAQASPLATSVQLSWTKPTDTDFAGVLIRRNLGSVAPATPTDGTQVGTTNASTAVLTDQTVSPSTVYSYSLFAFDGLHQYSSAVSILVTTLPLSTTVPPLLQRDAGHVTADVLPTVQIDGGVVWTQAVAGSTVYAGGELTQTRPAGAAPGTNLTPRNNLLAFDIATGNLISSFAPVVNGPVYRVAVSPDQSALYIAGAFTEVNGFSRAHIAKFDLPGGQLDSGFRPAVSAKVQALAVTNSTVYLGGSFTAVGGVNRGNLAAVQASDGGLTGWAPTADQYVQDMAISPDGSKIYVAGVFDRMNNAAAYGLAALTSTSGTLLPFPANSVVRAYHVPGADGSAGFFSIQADEDSVYATAWNYNGGGNFEGSVRTDLDGNINWIEDCHGDTYDALAENGVVYTVGHAHYCQTLNGWGVYSPWVIQHSTSFTKSMQGVLGRNTQGGYANFQGRPAPSLYAWLPDFTTGTYTGKSQSAWSLTGNSQYVVEGGEFPTVNGVTQQGLVRFAVPSIAPNKERPRVSGKLQLTLSSASAGTVDGSWPADWDRDDLRLRYTVVRDGGTASPVFSLTADAEWWNEPTLSFTDKGLTAGSHTYQVIATDGDGNATKGPVTAVTVG
jgi:hypothetical protein